MLSFAIGGVVVLALALGWFIQATTQDMRSAIAEIEALKLRCKRLEAVTHFPLDPPRSSFDMDAANRKLTEKSR